MNRERRERRREERGGERRGREEERRKKEKKKREREEEITEKNVVLQERDIEVLRWIGEQYAVRFDTVKRLLGRRVEVGADRVRTEGELVDRNVRRIIKRWRDAGLVGYRKILSDQPGWVWLTNRGLRELGFTFREVEPNLAELNHMHAINELRLALENRYGERMQWKGERELRREWGELDPMDRQGRHLTDAELYLDEHIIGIEVELSQKQSGRLRAIIDKLRHQYPGIWYFVSDTTRPVVERAVGPYSQKFRIYDIEQILT